MVMDDARSMGFPMATPPQEGLSLQGLEKMLSDIRFQPKWREESDRADDYYDGHQLSTDVLSRMERLGIPPLVTNLIRPAIDAVLGMEAKTRSDWRIIQEDDNAPVPERLIEALNVKLTEAERETQADRACAEAYAGQVKSGVGWVEVGRAIDAFGYPYRVSQVHRDEIWWDWRAKQLNLSDARYLIRKRRFDEDVLLAMMPEHKDLITNAVENSFRTWQWDTRDLYNPDLTYAAHVERITNLDEHDWRDAERKRATLFEVWYREWKRGPVLKLPNGKVIPYNPMDMRQEAAVRMGALQPFESMYSEVRVAFYLGPHRLYDFKSPYPHNYFPYVPFWGFRESKSQVPYGLIRGMMSPQDVVNSADARMHWMLNARRLIAHSDAIDTHHNTWRNVQDELARPDAVVLLDPNRPNAVFKVEQDFALTNQQYQRRLQAANDIENAGGIYKAMLGKEGGATSGIAINALVEQGSVTLAEMNDNYRFARRQVGEMLFSLVYQDIAREQIPVTVGKGKSRTQVILNQKMPDGTVQNSIGALKVKVVLEDVPSTAAYRAQQLMMLTEVTKSLPPEMQALVTDLVIDLTDAPKKDEIIERLRKAMGVSDPNDPEAVDPEKEALKQQIQQLMQLGEQVVGEGQQKLQELEQKLASAELQLKNRDQELALRDRELQLKAAETDAKLQTEERKMGLEERKLEVDREVRLADSAKEQAIKVAETKAKMIESAVKAETDSAKTLADAQVQAAQLAAQTAQAQAQANQPVAPELKPEEIARQVLDTVKPMFDEIYSTMTEQAKVEKKEPEKQEPMVIHFAPTINVDATKPNQNKTLTVKKVGDKWVGESVEQPSGD